MSMTGKVKFWNPAGWGIITPEGVKRGDRKREVFIYQDKLPEGLSQLDEGQEVEFSLNPLFGVNEERRALTVRLLGRQAYVPIDQQRRKAVAHGD